MWDFNLLAATRTLESTMPFVLYRFMVYLGISLGYLFAAVAGAGSFIAFASFSAKPTSMANFGAVLGFAGLGYLLYKFRGTLLFNMKAGQLALLAGQARGEKLPEGKAQVDFAKQVVTARFTASEFFAVSETIGRVLRELPREFCIPVRGIASEEAAKLVAWLVGQVLYACHQAIVVLYFFGDESNPWRSASVGLVLQTRHFAALLKYRLYALAFETVGLVSGFVVLLYPANALAESLPADVGVWPYVITFVFAWGLKSAFFSPIATAALSKLYLDLMRSEPAPTDAEIAALENCSVAFSVIRGKAA